MLNLRKKWNLNLSYISKIPFFNFKRNLKRETSDHGTLLHKVYELLLITLQLIFFVSTKIPKISLSL